MVVKRIVVAGMGRCGIFMCPESSPNQYDAKHHRVPYLKSISLPKSTWRGFMGLVSNSSGYKHRDITKSILQLLLSVKCASHRQYKNGPDVGARLTEVRINRWGNQNLDENHMGRFLIGC